MTHDELLTLINDEITQCEPECNEHRWDNAPWLSLRVVVGLHKPKDGWCVECSLSVVNVPYPCFTIQAIEKELQ